MLVASSVSIIYFSFFLRSWCYKLFNSYLISLSKIKQYQQPYHLAWMFFSFRGLAIFFLREANEYSAFFRHVVLVHSPTIYYNWYGGVVDAIYRARKGLVTKEEVKKQISIVAYGINSAAQILKLSPIEWTILSSPRKVSQLEDLVM